MCYRAGDSKFTQTKRRGVTYAHQTVLGHPGGFLALITLARCAAHVEEAERRGAAAFAVRFEHCVEARERILVAHAADLVEVDSARFARCNGDGPNDDDNGEISAS